MSDELERKLKRERIEVCLNCEWFEDCDKVGKMEECVYYEEVDLNRMYVIISLRRLEELERYEKEVLGIE